MTNRNPIFTTILLALGCLALLPVAQAVPPPRPEDRGNGNSAAENVGALALGTTGSNNTAHGWFSLTSNTTGSANSADGFQALYSNTTGIDNTANGSSALYSNTGGSYNTATGAFALLSNIGGDNNTAAGFFALGSNNFGSANTATGNFALASNTTADGNTADGNSALVNNTTGSFNTAIGYGALSSNTTGDENTAVGPAALFHNTRGGVNTAIGVGALQFNTTGDENTAVGYLALDGNTTGVDNIAVGHSAGLNINTGDENIDIGNEGTSGDSNTIRIGSSFFHNRTFIAGIRGVATGNDDAIPVVIDSAGQLGTASSSARFKTDIKPMNEASEAVLALKPVTFHYKDSARRRPQFGLIAEDVAKVNPDLVVRDADGKIYTVRYDSVNAMLLNEFLKEHQKVERLEEQVAALTAGLQKVSAQLEVNKPAPRTVLDSQ